MDSSVDCLFVSDLIEAVRHHEVLYDKRHKRYYEIPYKKYCWVKIAEATNRTPDECKNKWKTLRETFVKKSKAKRSGRGVEDNTPWPYFENLLFLKDFIKPRNRKTTSNEVFPAVVDADDESFSNSQELPVVCQVTPSPPPSASCSEGSIRATLKAIEEAALAVQQQCSAFPAQESTNLAISKALAALLDEIPSDNLDKARAELFQCVFTLKEKYKK